MEAKIKTLIEDTEKEIRRRTSALDDIQVNLKVACKMEFEAEKKLLFAKRDLLQDHIYDLKNNVKELTKILNPETK